MKKLFILTAIFCALNLSSQVITLQDLKDYQEYCYNDSTMTHSYVGNWQDCYMLTSHIMTNELDLHLSCTEKSHFEWVHKRTTFQGFVEWMERPYDIKGDTIIILKKGEYKFGNVPDSWFEDCHPNGLNVYPFDLGRISDSLINNIRLW